VTSRRATPASAADGDELPGRAGDDHAITVLRRTTASAAREILAQPKIYGFDTGFIPRQALGHVGDDDCGLLWEHLVLETLQSIEGLIRSALARQIASRGDFVLPRARDTCDATSAVELRVLPPGKTWRRFERPTPTPHFVVSPRKAHPVLRRERGLEVTHLGLDWLRTTLPLTGARAR